MRTIQLKAVPMDVPGAGETFDYRAQLLSILRTSSPSENGFDLGTMRTALKVLDKLDAAKSGSVVDMNDDEWEYVKGRIEQLRAHSSGVFRKTLRLGEVFSQHVHGNLPGPDYVDGELRRQLHWRGDAY
jgi:hypothetical protein